MPKILVTIIFKKLTLNFTIQKLEHNNWKKGAYWCSWPSWKWENVAYVLNSWRNDSWQWKSWISHRNSIRSNFLRVISGLVLSVRGQIARRVCSNWRNPGKAKATDFKLLTQINMLLQMIETKLILQIE